MTTFNPFGWLNKGADWASSHKETLLWVAVILGATILIAVLLYFAFRYLLGRRPRRDAVKRTRKSLRRICAESPRRARELWTTGNEFVPPACWGVILGGPKATSNVHVVFTRPRRGLLKWFKIRANVVANHLIQGTLEERFEVQALSMSEHGLFRWPDDDLSDKGIREQWESVIERGRVPHLQGRAEENPLDLATAIGDYYVQWIRHQVVLQERFEAMENQMENWSIAATQPLHELRGERPQPERIRIEEKEVPQRAAN